VRYRRRGWAWPAPLTFTFTVNSPALSFSSSSLTDRYKRPVAGALTLVWLPMPNGAPLPIRPISAPASAFGIGAPVAWRPLFAPARGGNGRTSNARTAWTPLFGQWLAGQLAMARELAYFYAPSVNSYKRYQSGSFAPTRVAAGWDNRTCGFRLCGEGPSFRVENRIPGADANPYLAFAATIAAGLHGIQARLRPPKPYEGNAYEDGALPQVPKTLREAIAELERSKAARTAFGERVVEHYAHAARLEQQAFDQAVTDWELMRYFERI